MTSGNWLEEKPVYEGWGKAEFSDPCGFVAGPTKLVFSAENFPSCIMAVKKFAPSLPFGLSQLLSGEEQTGDTDELILPITSGKNCCSSLTIQCQSGRFYSENVDIARFSYLDNNKVSFNVKEGRYDVTDAGKPRYFVIPILNFLTEFPLGSIPFFEHPLRYLQRSLCPGKTDQEKIALFLLMNKVIIFNFRDTEAFIEPLPDYEERKDSLKNKIHAKKVTAVLVGDCLEPPKEPKEIDKYFSSRLHALIALGTGQLVGAPWMEVRTESNKLVSRLHHQIGNFPFQLSNAPVPMFLGGLICIGMSATIVHENAWIVACRHAAMAGRLTATIEERLQSSFAGLETLNKAYGFSIRNLLSEVPAEYREKITNILADAKTRIDEISKTLVSPQEEAKAALESIGQRVLSASQQDQKFAVATLALMAKYNLPDIKIVESLQLSRPWVDLLGFLRGSVVHQGYIDIESDNLFQEYRAFSNHIRDILVRILLKMASFSGDYEPLTMNGSASEPVDFLEQQFRTKGNMAAQYLGYPCHPFKGAYGKIELRTKTPQTHKL